MSALLALLLASVPASAADAARPVLPLATRWTVDLPAPPVPGAVPVSDDAHVYVAISSGQVVARNNADGSEAWNRAIAVDGPLAADGGLIYAAAGDALRALRGSDGGTAWEAPLEAPSAPVLAQGGWVLAIAGRTLKAFRGADGTLVWQREVGDVSVQPSIDGARIYVAADDGRVLALNLLDGTPLWEQRLPARPSEPFPWGDLLYVGGANREFYCLKTKNGELAWQWRVGASVHALPSADDTRVYFAGLDNVLRALDRVTGVQKWQAPLRRRPAGGPVVLQRWVFVPSSSSPEIWVWTAGGRAAGTLAIPSEPSVVPQFVEAKDGGRIYVVTGNLAGAWQLTLIGTAADPPAVPLTEMPGSPVSVELPRQ